MAVSKDDPGVVGIAQEGMRPAVNICRAVYGGTLFLRENEEYLPQWEKEEDDVYEDRLAGSVLFNAYKKTIKSLSGIVYREPPEVEEVAEDDRAENYQDPPDEFWAHLENIDLSGQHFDLFSLGVFTDKMIDGHSHILVDWHGPEGARSSMDEKIAEARPYWTLIRKSQVVRDWTRQEGGSIVLMSWAYEEKVIIKDGEFAQKEVSRVRQFDLTSTSGEPFEDDEPLPPPEARGVLFRSWIQVEDGGEWELEGEGEDKGKVLGPNMNEIPVATDYGERTGFHRSEPVLLDLALENLKHWVIRSDRDQNLHVTSIPILNVYGMKAEDLQAVTVGTSMGLAFPEGRTNQGSEYTEAMGHGLTHSREELQDIQQRMAALGLSMLERQTRVAETEKAKMMDQKAQDSELAGQARLNSDALEEACRLHLKWMGAPDARVAVEVNTDFTTDQMSPELFDKYLKAVGEGHLSAETMWDRLMAGKLLPGTFDPELEKELIAEQGKAELEAMAEANRKNRLEGAAGDEQGEASSPKGKGAQGAKEAPGGAEAGLEDEE
jgi:hypothetical protein